MHPLGAKSALSAPNGRGAQGIKPDSARGGVSVDRDDVDDVDDDDDQDDDEDACDFDGQEDADGESDAADDELKRAIALSLSH